MTPPMSFSAASHTAISPFRPSTIARKLWL